MSGTGVPPKSFDRNVVPKKISMNELKRDNIRLTKENMLNADKATVNYRALCVTAAKLYALSPEDEIFTNKTFPEKVLELIKEESTKYQEEFKKRLSETVDEVKVVGKTS